MKHSIYYIVYYSDNYDVYYKKKNWLPYFNSHDICYTRIKEENGKQHTKFGSSSNIDF